MVLRISVPHFRGKKNRETAFFLLDVRPENAFRREHIAGAVSIPHHVLGHDQYPGGAEGPVRVQEQGPAEQGEGAQAQTFSFATFYMRDTYSGSFLLALHAPQRYLPLEEP